MEKVGLMINISALKKFIQSMFNIYENCKAIGMDSDDIRVRVDKVIQTLTNVIGSSIVADSNDCVVEI